MGICWYKLWDYQLYPSQCMPLHHTSPTPPYYKLGNLFRFVAVVGWCVHSGISPEAHCRGTVRRNCGNLVSVIVWERGQVSRAH